MMIRMMPELELVESQLVTDVGAFSTLVGVATLSAIVNPLTQAPTTLLEDSKN